MTGEWPKGHVDHINGDKLDNRLENLRDVPPATNFRNRGANRNNTTGFKGVTYDKRRKKFLAQLKVDRRHVYVGRFDTAEEAHAAYLAAVTKRVGGIQYREAARG